MEVNKIMAQQKKSTYLELNEIMKSLFVVSKKVLLEMMNALFHENFNEDETEISFESNEFVTDAYDIIRGDLFLRIVQDQKPHHYHIELQTTNDNNMVIRMFEYGFAKAKELKKYQSSDQTTIYIPNQLVIFIEENKGIPDEIWLKMVFPNQQEVIYSVPTLKYWQYTKEEIVAKRLYPLLPLQVFKIRVEMEKIRRKNGNREHLQTMIEQAKEVVGEIGSEARRLYDCKTITTDDLHKILLANKNLFDYLNERYIGDKELESEVSKMTKSLIDPAVLQEGIEKGKIEGIVEGIEKTLHIMKAIRLGSSDEEIMETYQVTYNQLCAIKEQFKASS